MRLVFSLFLLSLCSVLFGQKFQFQSSSENYQKDQFDITSSIPFDGGLLSVVMDKKNSFTAKYEIKLCKVDKGLVTEKNISINFEAESWVRLIGLYQINNKPVIFYTNYQSFKGVLHINAIIINPNTLQIIENKEVKKYRLPVDDPGLIETWSTDADWISQIDVKLSYDNSKYLLVYQKYKYGQPAVLQKFREVYFAVFDSDANLLFEKIEEFPQGFYKVKFLDFCLTNSNQILTLYSLTEKPSYKGRINSSFITFVRSLYIESSKSIEVKFDNQLGFVRNGFFLFNSKNTQEIDVVGVYSQEWDSEDLSGGFHITYNTDEGKINTVARQPIPIHVNLVEIYPHFYKEKGIDREDKPLYYRLSPVYIGRRANGSIDLLIEYKGPYHGKVRLASVGEAMDFDSFINLNFSNGEMITSVVRKKQVKLSADGQHMLSVFATPYNDKLLVFYNDVAANIQNVEKEKEFVIRDDTNYGILVAEIDAKGQVVKKGVALDFKENHYAELRHSKRIGQDYFLFRISDPHTRYKKFGIGSISIQ